MKKYLIIPIVAFVILIFIFGIYAGATKTFPYNIIKSCIRSLQITLIV